MPRIRLEDVLLDVDRRCGFTRAFRPLAGYEPRGTDTYRTLLATLIAHGTNLGLTAMGSSVERLTAADLQHASRWLVRDATLKAANAQIIEYQHRLTFAAIWGDGRLSSSDGQRFAAPPGTLIGAYHPRYFGYYDRAVSVYSHLSDRLGVYGTQVISCAPREATYVLTSILDNDTSIDPEMHTTDTHGFTESLWGLCYLLGIDFMPRLKDLADQRLWRSNDSQIPDLLAGLFAGNADVVAIIEQWDQLVRIAASHKARTAPAHVVLQRLTSSGPSDRVAKSLTALGRLVKTRNILRYLHDGPLRLRIQVCLPQRCGRHTDMEHSTPSMETIADMALLARALDFGLAVRPPKANREWITRLLDVGVWNLHCPQVENAQHAAEIVAASRYAPRGLRGNAGHSPATDYDTRGTAAERRAFANQQVFVTVMFETAAAFDDLDAIAAMDGIDALTIGPADLAQDLGVFGSPDQARILDEKRDLVLAAARKHGKTCAMLCANQEQAQQWKQAGALILAYGSDSEILHSAFSQAIGRIKG